MPQKQTPQKQVKEKFGNKEKLVDEIVSLLKPARGEKEELRESLSVGANSKLLQLHANALQVKETFGGKEKLVETILDLMKHPKDEDRKEKLLEHGPGRLLDIHRRWEKKAGAKAGSKAG